MSQTHISILGDGQMGLVCAAVLSQHPDRPRVTLWGHERRPMEALAQTRVSPRLEMLSLPPAVRVTGDDSVAMEGADLIVSAIPTQFIRAVWGRLSRFAPPPETRILSVAKGIENGSLLRPTQIVLDALGEDVRFPTRRTAVLSGPTIATELARCLPATMIVAGDDSELTHLVQRLFTTSWLRVYTGSDPIGVEIAGATKNIIAIAAGILDGLRAGNNAKSALLARGLAEIARLGTAMKAKPETFFGIAGVGDLATTCFSPEGRNRSLGEALGRGEKLDDYLARTQFVVEGVATTKAVMELSKRMLVDMPITAAVHAVLYEGLDPIDGIARLMTREPKAERVG